MCFTFTIATFWVVYYMMSHPEALTAVKDEVRNVLGDKVCVEILLMYMCCSTKDDE